MQCRWWQLAAYLLVLYAWWNICSSYFEPELVTVHRRAEYEDNYGATPASSVVAKPTAAAAEVPAVGDKMQLPGGSTTQTVTVVAVPQQASPAALGTRTATLLQSNKQSG